MEEIWQIVYFPTEDDKDSPYQYLLSLPDAEYVRLTNRLALISDSEFAQWRGFTWLKMWERKIWQIDGAQNRVMFCIDETRIVVLHAFKKVKQHTHARDVRRVHSNYADFVESRERRDENPKDPH